MPTNQKNNPDIIDANPSLDNAGLSIASSVSASNIAGAAYSPTADSDLSVSADSTRSSDSSKNVNVQMVTHLYYRASRWISENPTLAISAVIGIVAAVLGIVVANKSSRQRSGNSYTSGETYGNSYDSGAVTNNLSTQTESIDREGNYTSSGSDSFAGYDSATEGNTGW
jgi:hypothetical protein